MSKKHKATMSFLDHLEELRWLLIRSSIGIVIGAIVAFIFSTFIFDHIIFAPKNPDFYTYNFFCQLANNFNLPKELCVNSINLPIQNREMAGQFSFHLKVSITLGFIFSFPYILWELWKFIKPALYQKERSRAASFVIISSILFFIGILFGYYLIAPLSINFFANYNLSKVIENEIDLGSYIALIRSSTIACGVLFELPVLVFFLTKFGLITPAFLKKYRKHTIIIILLLSALITPPDVISQVIVSIPILILYEISIWISALVIKKEKSLVVKS